jgi:hypothetical protein
VSIQIAAGNIIVDTGHGDFGAYLPEGEIPGGVGRLVFGSAFWMPRKLK